MPVHYFGSFAMRDAFVLSIASARTDGTLVAFKKFTSTAGKFPVFSYPNVNAMKILKNSKTDICDFTELRKHGVYNFNAVRNDLLNSSLSGAWPKQALNNALANYARQLFEWQSNGTISEHFLRIPNRCVLDVSYIEGFLRNFVFKSLGIIGISRFKTPVFKRNDLGYPAAQAIHHHYSGLTALVRPLGLSVGASVKLLIEAASGESKCHKLLSVIQRKRRDLTKLGQSFKILGDYTVFLEQHISYAQKLSPTICSRYLHNVFNWLDGATSLLPPTNSGWSSDFLTFNRDCTLFLAEHHGPAGLIGQLLSNEAITISFSINHLERCVTKCNMRLFHEVYPGIILRD
jgi:hypothetical protein